MFKWVKAMKQRATNCHVHLKISVLLEEEESDFSQCFHPVHKQKLVNHSRVEGIVSVVLWAVGV